VHGHLQEDSSISILFYCTCTKKQFKVQNNSEYRTFSTVIPSCINIIQHCSDSTSLEFAKIQHRLDLVDFFLRMDLVEIN
jgi:hypothetical protein